jgi:replicative DNA helicase
MGKAQPLDAPVLTPTGYVRMGELRSGSLVIGADGRPHRVVALFPQGTKQVFRIRFSDGATVECCDEHLWFTTTRAESRRPGANGSVKPLAEIRQTLRASGESERLNHRIPLVAPIEFAPRDQPLVLAPYLLGLLLGEGSFRGEEVRFAAGEWDLRERLVSQLPPADTISIDGISLRVIESREPQRPATMRTSRGARPSQTRLALEHYGIFGLSSAEKFIPEPYLFATVEQRLDLLRALFDTSGHVIGLGGRTVEFTTSSPRLLEGVIWLVQSLGGVVSRREELPSQVAGGERRRPSPVTRIEVSFPNGIVPVSSKKHLARWDQGADAVGGRFIASVEEGGEKPCQCILVDSDEHLYVTSGFVVTHNTAYCLNVATHVGCRARFDGKRVGVGIFSLEMPKEQLVMRMLASEARVDSQRIRTGHLIESDWPKLAHAAGVLAEANIHIDDSPSLSALELRAKSRRLAGRFSGSDAPLGLVIIDYLQLMKGNERVDSREQQISEISRSLKALAKELNLPVLALSQLNRSLEKRPDKRPQLSDLRESGSIEQDADTVIFLFREEVYEKDKEDVKGIAEIIVGKQRNGPIGTANAAFIHEFTRFENLARDYVPRVGH